MTIDSGTSLIVQQEIARDTHTAWRKQPRNLTNIVLHIVWQHVGKDRGQEDEIEAARRKRKGVLARTQASMRVVGAACDVRMMELEVRMDSRDRLLTPHDGL